MLQFKQSDTTADLYLTLTENATLALPFNYLFVFTHVTTRDVVAFILNTAADLSLYPDRYNKFTINPSVVFTGKQPGEWHYAVYQQASSSNLNPNNASGLIEVGKLMIDRPVDFAFSMYSAATTYKTYNG